MQRATPDVLYFETGPDNPVTLRVKPGEEFEVQTQLNRGPWLDAHPDFNTPETTRSGSLGGMPVAVATGRALQGLRLDAHLDPPLADRLVVMGGVRLTDPLEQHLLDQSLIEQVSVDDMRQGTPAVFAQLARLSRITDKISVHIDTDVLDPRDY